MRQRPRAVLLTAGTRGDVQPFVALALGLRRAGWDVRLAAPVSSAALVTGHGIAHAPIRVDYQALLASDEGRAMLANPLRAVRAWRSHVLPLFRAVLDDAWAAARDADVLVYHPKILGAPEMAARAGARAFVAALAPLLTPTRAFPAPVGRLPDLGPTLNRWSHAILPAAARPFAGPLRRWRAEALGLPAGGPVEPFRLHGAPVPVLYGFSEHVVPRPDDWPPSAHVTGYWFVDEPADDRAGGEPGWTPSRELLAFLAAGPPPVYVGLGSVAGRDPGATTHAVLDAVRRAGARAVLATGWGGLAELPAGDLPPDRVHVLADAPHGWLFPRMDAVVHHGGAGSTAAGLRAGRPTVVCPAGVDQPFWGARVAALGVGPAPLPLARLRADGLARAIRAAMDDGAMRRRAAALGARLQAERGVARAVSIIGAAADGATADGTGGGASARHASSASNPIGPQ